MSTSAHQNTIKVLMHVETGQDHFVGDRAHAVVSYWTAAIETVSALHQERTQP
jgi:hypothetical protein